MIRGIAKVKKNLNIEIMKIKNRSLAGLVVGGEIVRKDAMKKAPIMTGNLRNSSYVSHSKGSKNNAPDFNGDDASLMSVNHSKAIADGERKAKGGILTKAYKVIVGFSAVYALSTHENPRAGITGGVSPSGTAYKPPKGSTQIAYAERGGWKFLERSLGENANKILKAIRDKARIRR